MSFRDLIEGMHKADPSILGGALAGSDGMPVEEWQSFPQKNDFQALCAEMAQYFKESGRITGENGLGAAVEATVTGDLGMVFVRRVTEDYFLLLVAGPEAVPGRCRFSLRQGARRVRELL